MVRWSSTCTSLGCKCKFNRADVGRSGWWVVARIEVKSSQYRIPSVWIEVENVTDRQCQKIYATLDSLLSTEKQVSNAVAKAFQLAIELCPRANPSDLWHHIIYRHLLARGFSDQRWKRVSGFALERALVNIYAPRLDPYGVRARLLPALEASRLLAALGVRTKASKIDIFLEGFRSDGWTEASISKPRKR